MGKLLGKKFFERSAVDVAEELVGKYLVIGPRFVPPCGTTRDKKIEKFMITETEAYEGEEDLASHASKGRTQRTEVMFGEAGIFYVYLVYGMYYMLNVVTGKKGHPGAVLVRRIERLKDSNIERSGEKKNGINGPGKVTKFLNIDKKLNGLPAIPKTGIWFECSDKKFKIKKAKRIGVTYAGPVWSNKLWRFLYQS